MKTYRKIKAYLSDLRQRLVLLTSALHVNTATTDANNALSSDLLASLDRIAAAVEYLQSVERHRQSSAGQKSEF
jgi:hypothetical protein